MKPTIMAAVAAVALLAAGAANAGILYYQADLKGAGASPAKGEMKAVLDTDSRSLDVTVTGLTGPATSAGFATNGQARPELAVPIAGAGHATVTLTNAQIQQLNTGSLSFFVDTKSGPGGELRGKVSRSSGVL